MPLSPISVKSPEGKISKSGNNSQFLTILSYFDYIISLPKIILFLKVSLNKKLSYGTIAILPFFIILPCYINNSFVIDFKSEDLPHPTFPIIATNSPFFTFRLILVNTGNKESLSFLISLSELIYCPFNLI